ncbi:virion RNA polymerase [Vibrio phage K479]
MSDMLNPDDLGGVNENGGVADSNTPSSFTSPMEQSLFAALPGKQAQVEQASVRVPLRTEEASTNAQDRVNQNAGLTREEQFAQSIQESLPEAQETQKRVARAEGADILGSLQTGTVRLGQQIYNIPSSTDLGGRLNSLSADEISAINEVRGYESKRDTLQKSLADIVERTDLDPLAREFMRGTVQKELDKLSIPEEAMAVMESQRKIQAGGGLGSDALLAGGITDAKGGGTLRQFVDEIDVEYADLKENDKFFEQFKAKTNPVFKEDFQRANEETTKEGLKQASEGVKAFEEGRYASAVVDVIGGSLRTVGGSVEAALDNPEAIFEIVSETAPQMASAFIPYVNLLTNTAYVGDVYKEALNEYKEENNGSLPDKETLATMQTAAIGAGLLEVAADKFLVGGSAKLADGLDPALKAAAQGAKGNKYINNAVSRVGVRGASSAVTEGATEAGQTALEEVAKGNEVSGAEVSASAVIGAAAGSGFAGGAQAVKETASATKKGAELVSETASKATEAVKKAGPSKDETLVRQAGKTASKPSEKQTPKDKKQIQEAKNVLSKQEAILTLLRDNNMPEEAIQLQEAKVNKLKARVGGLDTVKADAEALTTTTDEQSADEFLEQVSYQIDLDEDGELDANRLQQAVDIAVQKGATDEQVAGIQAIIQAKKSSAEVSTDITVGSKEWRGGGTYLANIVAGLASKNDAKVVYNLQELERFEGYIGNKVADYKAAYEESQKLGRSVPIINKQLSRELGEDIPYEQLDGNPAYADGRTAALLTNLESDWDILAGTLDDANKIIDSTGNSITVDSVLSEYAAPETVAPEAPVEETEDTASSESETQTEAPETEAEAEPVSEPEVSEEVSEEVEPVEPTIKANTNKVEQDLDTVVEEVSSSADRATATDALELPESKEVVARAMNSTKSAATKQAIRELGRRIQYKEEYGTNTTPLDSSIPEAHYEAGMEAIRQAYVNPDFGKLKEKTVGDAIVETMPSRYEGEVTSEEDAFLLTNEFVEEITVDSFVANEGVSPGGVRQRANEVTVANTKAASIIKGLRVAYAPISAAITKRYDGVMAKKFKNSKFSKFDTNFLSNFRDDSNGLVSFLRDGAVLSSIEYLINNSKTNEAPTTSMVQAFGNLDSKESVPDKLYALAAETGIGETRERVIESLAATAFKIGGVRFKGTRGNTEVRHKSAIGKLMLDSLIDIGVITPKRIAVNKLVWAGANYDNQGTIQQLKAEEVETYPRRFVSKFINYNGVVYEWTGSNYRVYAGTEQGNYVTTYLVNPEAELSGIALSRFLKEMAGTSTSFSKVFGTDHVKRIPAMSVPRKNDGKVKGFSHKKLNKTQREAQNKQSEQPLFLDKGIMDIKEAFGDARILRIAGSVDFDEDTTNKVVALSKTGKNQTVLADLNGLNQFILDMEAEAEVLGLTDYRDVQFYANFSNSSYQRQFVDSQTFNYQSSKSMHRFMAHHGEQEFTLADDVQRVNFLVSVAQGFDISVDKLSSATSVQKLHELVEAESEVVGLMQKWERDKKLDDASKDAITDFAAKHENMHTLLALREFARYLNALDAGAETMNVVMPIELDGVNNGPITAILQSLTHADDYESALRRAGITDASKDTRTSGERYEQKKDGLYEEGAEAVQEDLKQVATNLQEAGNTVRSTILRSQTQLKALKAKLVTFNKGVQINRNETKGIITKLFYNAGDKSLLKAEVDDLTSNFYAELQNVIDGKEGANLKRIVGHVARASVSPEIPFSQDDMSADAWNKLWTTRYHRLMEMLQTPEQMIEFSLPAEVVKGLIDNMSLETSYGRVKLDAIKHTYSSAVRQSKVVTKMTTIGGIFARDKVNKAIEAKHAELGLTKYETLPNKEVEAIYAKLGRELPNLSLDMHTEEDYSDAIPLYSYTSTPVDKASRSQYALSNSGTAPVYIAGKELSDMGAGGVAASTISVADASTIMGIMGQLNEGFMTVFDGVLINGLKMDTLGQASNVAYHKSIRNNNTFTQIYSNYNDVVGDVTPLSDQLLDEAYDSLVSAETKKMYKNPTRLDKVVEVENAIDYVNTTAAATSANIRKNEALGQRDLSVDQFGAVNDKTTIITPAGNALNKFDELDVLSNNVGEYYEKDNEGFNLTDDKIVSKQTNNSVLSGFLSRNWTTSGEFSVRGTKTKLVNLVKQAGVPTSEYYDFLTIGLIDNVLMPAFKNIGSLPKVVVVTDEGMRAAVGRDTKAKGAYVYSTNTVYLNQDRNGVNAETLFHELVHAALDGAVVGKGRSNAKFAQALEDLGQEAAAYLQKNSEVITRFTDTGPETDINNSRIPWLTTRGNVNTREFLSWSLTNFHIITELSQAPAETNPDGLFGKIFKFIQDVLMKIMPKKSREFEDSIFSFIFATAAELAEDAVVPQQKKGRSLQEDYSTVQNATHQDTFENLADNSNVSQAELEHLHTIFESDIVPAIDETPYSYGPHINNSVEKMNNLAQSDVGINPNGLGAVFGMSPIHMHVYEMYQKVMKAGLNDFKISGKDLAELYRTAKAELAPVDFLLEGEVSSDSIAMSVAKNKYDSVFLVSDKNRSVEVETNFARVDTEYNRSNYLANFAALARTNTQFRTVLERAYVRRADKREKLTLDNLDVVASNTMVDIVGFLVDTQTKARGQGTYRARIDTLAGNIAATDQRSKSFLEQKLRKLYGAKDVLYAKYAKAFETVLSAALNNRPIKKIRGLTVEHAKGIAEAFGTDKSTAVDAIFYQLHHGYMQAIPRFIEELSATNERNKMFRRLSISKTKAVAGARDGDIKATKSVIRDLFKNGLTDTENNALTDILLDGDFHALHEFSDLTAQDLIDVLRDDARLDHFITDYENRLYSTSQTYSHFHVKSAYSLGTLIATGQASEGFTLTNADLIANFTKDGLERDFSTADVLNNIDVLASLVALKHANKVSRSMVAQLYANQSEAMEGVHTMLTVYKDKVLKHQYNGNSNRVLKSNSQEIYDDFRDIRFVTKENLSQYTTTNYRLVRVIQKDTQDGNPEDIYMIASATGGLGTYQQGQYSTINSALNGIENLDGRTTTNGYDDYQSMQKYSKLTKIRKHRAINAMFAQGRPTLEPKELLVPVVNDTGTVTGFQYTVARKEKEHLLGRDKRFSEVLPASMGRTVEATHSDDFNKKVNAALKASYDAEVARGTDSASFIEISATAPTKRGREAYRMMPPAARAHLQTIWGEKAFIHSSLMDTVYGYRKASLANVFRKNSESPKWAKQLGKMVTNNYKYESGFVDATLIVEKGLGELSSFIKDLIVVRGMQVMFGNMLSNTVQLVLQEDMGLTDAVKLQVEGMRHAKTYQQQRSKVRRLVFQEKIEQSPEKKRAIKTRIAEIEEELAKNPARELIDAGLLTAIVEDIDSGSNPFSYTSEMSSYVSGVAAKLPKGAKYVIENAAVSQDSSVYEALYMFTQLGDFSSRYAVAKHREKLKGEPLNEKDIDEIVDAFVNYDLPSNKYLQYMGDIGQMWFFKYFFRIQQVIIRNSIKNPRRVFDFVAMSHLTGLNISTYFDAFFLFNSITNKLGFQNYAEMGIESIPVVQVYDFVT